MPKSGALFAVCIVAGMLGTLVSLVFFWGCTEWGVFNFIGVNIRQTLTTAAVSPKLIIGGIWAIGYFLTVGTPRQRRHWVRKGLWFSILPSLFALFYYHPYILHNGLAATSLGLIAPVVIIIGNLIWGLFTGFFTRLLWGR